MQSLIRSIELAWAYLLAGTLKFEGVSLKSLNYEGLEFDQEYKNIESVH